LNNVTKEIVFMLFASDVSASLNIPDSVDFSARAKLAG
jgi:hypothetical protein